jgi:hypothetical protein
MTLIAGGVSAQNLGRFSTGLKFGILGVNKPNESEVMYPYLRPMFTYVNSFFDKSLDFYTGLNYFFMFNKRPNDKGDEVFPQYLYIELMARYNLYLGDSSTLSFNTEKKFDPITLSPRRDSSNNMVGIFKPSVKFTQGLDFGVVYAQIGPPIKYIQNNKNADTEVGLDITLGWNSNFGLGIVATVRTLLASNDSSGYLGFDTILRYNTGPISVEVEVNISKIISDEGIKITPELGYSLEALTFYLSCEFGGMGADGDIIVSPALLVKYSF